MEKILQLEKLLQDAAKLADEMNTANNAAEVPSDHVPGIRSRILGALGSLTFHKDFVAAQPTEEKPAA